MFTKQLIKSIGPRGDDKFTKNTPIIFPIKPSIGKMIHIPTTSSATRNCTPKKLMGWKIYPKAIYNPAVIAAIATLKLLE